MRMITIYLNDFLFRKESNLSKEVKTILINKRKLIFRNNFGESNFK